MNKKRKAWLLLIGIYGLVFCSFGLILFKEHYITTNTWIGLFASLAAGTVILEMTTRSK